MSKRTKPKKVTVVIQIGNSDDKLTQASWSAFTNEINEIIISHAERIHFMGASGGCKPWQNAAWVIEWNSAFPMLPFLKELKSVRKQYKQDSIAITVGDTQFI